MATVYAQYRIAFLAPKEATSETAGEMYHPCVTGLYDHIDDLIRSEFQEKDHLSSDIEQAREELRTLSLRAHFDLDIANIARANLGALVFG